MITVKQYAAERGISIQAVHQSMQGKKKKELLEGHVQVIEGVKWLDDEAVVILDKDRRKSQYLIEKAESSEEIEYLKQQIENLLIKTAAQADKISELAQWKADNAVAIAESNHKQLLLEEKTKEIGVLEGLLKDANSDIKHLQEEKESAVKAAEDKLYLAEQRADQLETKLKEEENRPLSLVERLTGRKRG